MGVLTRARVDLSRTFDKVTREFPAKRVRFVSVPESNETHDSVFEFASIVEAAIPQNSPLENRKPDLDLIDPGSMYRRINELESTVVPSIESAPTVVFAFLVDIQVVPNNKYTPIGVQSSNQLEKPHDRPGISPLDDLGDHVSRAHIECSEEGARAMTNVFKLVTKGGVSGRMRRVTPRKDLHGFLVDADDDGILGRIQVKLADTTDLGLEFHVGAMQPRPYAVRTKAFGRKDALHGRATDLDPGFQEQHVCDGLLRPYASKSCIIIRQATARQCNDFAARFQRNVGRTAGPRGIEECLEAGSVSPLVAPLLDGVDMAAEPIGHLGRASPVREIQNHRNPLGQNLRRLCPASTSQKPLTLGRRHLDRRATTRHTPPRANTRKLRTSRTRA